MKNKKYQVGIAVLAYDISPQIITRFVDSVHVDARPDVSFYIHIYNSKSLTIHEEKIYFCRNKGLNRCIEELADDCEVILCADIDLLIPPGYIDKSYEIALSRPFSGFIRKMPEGVVLTPRNWDEWIKFSVAPFAFGPWNALTTDDWFKIGGWNENMYSWGYDEHIYDRMIYHGLKPFREDIAPLVHVYHPRRNVDARDLEVGYENRIKQTIGVNFLNVNS